MDDTWRPVDRLRRMSASFCFRVDQARDCGRAEVEIVGAFRSSTSYSPNLRSICVLTSSTDRRTSLCIVAHNAYDAISGAARGFVGGVEWQTSLTARWLAQRGYSASMLTWDEGQADGEVIDGVRLLKICRARGGLPGLRFLHPKWTGLNGALRRANADVYYQNCGECVTGQVAMWCRRHHRAFVFSTASDIDCDVQLPELPRLRDRVLYRYGLRHADAVICQTEIQRQMLRDGFGRDASVIPMPCPGPSDHEFAMRSCPQSDDMRVLWIGRVCRVKRPDRLADLAAACPDMRFDLVGPASDDDFSRRAEERARKTPNITVHGAADRSSVGAFYQRSACLVSTSDYEGFPNTFLEAWSYGRPIVSTFDPDRLIETRKLGIVAEDVAGLAAGLRRLASSPELYREMSANARRYYLENHTVEAVFPKFERVILRAAEAARC